MISLIVAVSQNSVIGKDNKLPWHLKGDLKRFKEITTNHTIIMGRKTFESLPNLLPNRHHVVITRDKYYEAYNENITICNYIESVIDTYKDSDEEVFVIGGSEIYNVFKQYTTKVYLTFIFKDFEGDSYFNHNEILTKYHVRNISPIHNENDITYRFIDLEL